MIIEEFVLNYILLYLLLEVYEVQWQKAKTLMGMLARMYHYYRKSIFLFFLMHPTFYFSIAFMLLSEYNIYATILFFLKTLDIVMKIVLIKQVYIDKELTPEMTYALLSPINPLLPYVGLVAYPGLIFLAMS